MLMTHYMELLASNQPWNLLIFMALPVVLAETVAITELYILYTRKFDTWVRQVNRIASILVGITFVGIIAYLMFTAVIPITSSGAWRTWIDVVAVSTYLIGGVPMVLLALQELGLIHRAESEERRLARHATYVAVFLVFAHIAMVAGMMDPGILGYVAPAESHDMMNHH
ncbi:MAG: permease [Oxalobacteraceae bacterium]|nr:permease [Oxalobacteraceae bacterium]